MNIDYWLKCYGSPTAGVSIDDPLQAAVDLAAEVLRLREQLSGRTMHCANCEAMAREVEAWRWLAGWCRDGSLRNRSVSTFMEHGDDEYALIADEEEAWVGERKWRMVASVPHVNGQPDPVALARALGRKDGE